MQSYIIHRKQKVRNGFNVTATLTDSDTSRTKLFFVPGKVEPTDKSLQPKLEAMVARFAEKNLEAPETTMTKTEVEELLKSKNYLTVDQTLDDLPMKPKAVI